MLSHCTVSIQKTRGKGKLEGHAESGTGSGGQETPRHPVGKRVHSQKGWSQKWKVWKLCLGCSWNGRAGGEQHGHVQLYPYSSRVLDLDKGSWEICRGLPIVTEFKVAGGFAGVWAQHCPGFGLRQDQALPSWRGEYLGAWHSCPLGLAAPLVAIFFRR